MRLRSLRGGEDGRVEADLLLAAAQLAGAAVAPREDRDGGKLSSGALRLGMRVDERRGFGRTASGGADGGDRTPEAEERHWVGFWGF